MSRIHNFNAGPAALPLPVLERAQKELVEFDGTGMSILEHSHRGAAYDAVHNEAIAGLRSLMGIGDDYEVLFLQGGASLQFAMLPMNLLPGGKSADYVVTGAWSKKALGEAKMVGNARAAADVHVDGLCTTIPKQADLDLDDDAAYVHVTSNNTIFGTQFHDWPDTGEVPLIADMSSDILWRPTDVSRFSLIYAGAQKNVGPSGMAIVIARKSLLAGAREDLPNILRYSVHASKNSLFNTPNSFAVYMVRNVVQYLQGLGGLDAVEKLNRDKAALLYGALDADPDFFRTRVAKDSRSTMNVVFNLPSEELEKKFVAEATAAGLNGLKGHRSVGGIRASIYNAVPLASVQALVDFMAAFKANA
jgi:phosphoserine aminotransferase